MVHRSPRNHSLSGLGASRDDPVGADDDDLAFSHVPWEVRVLGERKRKLFVETDVIYAGERPSALGFFFMFKDIIFRTDGSVLGFIVIETSIAIGLGFAALHVCPEEEWSHLGHQFVGVLLAFLAVFRSQNSHTLWEQGRVHTGKIITSARALANEVLGTLVQCHVADGKAVLPAEAHKMVRLLKLVYFVAVEHVRSSDGYEAWDFAQRVAYSLATDDEVRMQCPQEVQTRQCPPCVQPESLVRGRRSTSSLTTLPRPPRL